MGIFTVQQSSNLISVLPGGSPRGWVSINSTTSPVWVKEEASWRKRKSQSLALSDGARVVPSLWSCLRQACQGLKEVGSGPEKGPAWTCPLRRLACQWCACWLWTEDILEPRDATIPQPLDSGNRAWVPTLELRERGTPLHWLTIPIYRVGKGQGAVGWHPNSHFGNPVPFQTV